MYFQNAELLTLRVQVVNRFLNGFGAGAHNDDNLFGISRAVVFNNVILAAGDFGELVHFFLNDAGNGVIIFVGSFATLEEDVRAASSISSIFWISCEVRKPSKKCMNGTRERSVEVCAIAAMSCASCTELEQSIAKPVWRQLITSVWSPKIDNAWYASERAATCMTNGESSPAILYIFGIIRSKP